MLFKVQYLSKCTQVLFTTAKLKYVQLDSLTCEYRLHMNEMC